MRPPHYRETNVCLYAVRELCSALSGGRLMHYHCFLQEFVETNTYHTQHLLHHTSKLSHLNKFPTNSLVSSYKFVTFLHYSSQTIRECRSSFIYFNSIEYRSSVRTTISPGILTKHY